MRRVLFLVTYGTHVLFGALCSASLGPWWSTGTCCCSVKAPEVVVFSHPLQNDLSLVLGSGGGGLEVDVSRC